ncbi:MAG: flagellar hook-basal body complex protein FliE [Treponema sp.]|nr:flagellar hook-basal body complex protein FliE [Treponema sp.]
MNSISELQLLRTNPAHAGTGPLGGDVARNGGAKKTSMFEAKLLEAVSAMNEQQLDVGRVEQQLITDPDSVDVHDVVTSMAKAQMSLSLAQTVIDRLVTGWNEISTTR